MSFIHKLYRDILIYTIPWVIARYLVYPLVFIDQRLQTDYKKKFENSSKKEKSLQPVFSISQKIAYFKKFTKVGGLKGLFEGWQLYVIPFTTSRLVEGITTTSLMYFFTEILGLKDHFYMLFSIALFFRHLFGSFTFRLTQGFQTSKEKINLAAYLDPNNKKFWKEYEIYHISYQVFRYIQAYMQLSTYWLFNPGFFFKIILYANSRVVGVMGAQPVVWLVRKSQDYGYNYKVAFQDLQKKYGTKNLFTGARDSSIIEATLSVFQIPLEYIVSSIV